MKNNFNWNDYNKARKNNPPRDTLLFALKKITEEKTAAGKCFDLGCGPGNDTSELLLNGWEVTATDSNPDILFYLEPLLNKYKKKLKVQIASFEDIDWKKCDLVNASFTLPFCPEEHFKKLWSNIVLNINKGGRFSGQFFGMKDEWKDLVRHTRKEILEMFSKFKIELIGEIEKDDQTAAGKMKHWHFFNIVAKKI
ncbi:MAG: class I SAM-dependent methyltransferase [Ignavibacteria bacterium]